MKDKKNSGKNKKPEAPMMKGVTKYRGSETKLVSLCCYGFLCLTTGQVELTRAFFFEQGRPRYIIEKDTICSLFHLPIEKAARKLGIACSTLKRSCRTYGIEKWPYRQVQSTRKKARIPTVSSLTPERVPAY